MGGYLATPLEFENETGSDVYRNNYETTFRCVHFGCSKTQPVSCEMSEEDRHLLEERLKVFLVDYTQESEYFDSNFEEILWLRFRFAYNYTEEECPPSLFNEFFCLIGHEQRKLKLPPEGLTKKIQEFIMESSCQEESSNEELWRDFLRKEQIFVEHCSFEEFRSEMTKFSNELNQTNIQKYTNMVIKHLKRFTGNDLCHYGLFTNNIFIFSLWSDFELHYPYEKFSSFAIYSAVVDAYAETLPTPTFEPPPAEFIKVHIPKIMAYLREFEERDKDFKFHKFLDEHVIFSSWNAYRKRYNVSAVECSYYIFRPLAKRFGESHLEMYKISIWKYLETYRQKSVFQYARFMDKTFIFNIWYDYRRVNFIQKAEACPFAVFATVAEFFAATLPQPYFGTIIQENKIDKAAVLEFINGIIDGGQLNVKDLLNEGSIFWLWEEFKRRENKTEEELPYTAFRDIAKSLAEPVYSEIQISFKRLGLL